MAITTEGEDGAGEADDGEPAPARSGLRSRLLPRLPPVAASSGFRRLWLGVTLSAVGTRATAAANLWLLQDLTGSVFAVALMSLVETLVLLTVAPFAGTVVDRVDRRRLLQAAQSCCLFSSAALAALTFTGHITPLWVYLLGGFVAGAAAFDTPTRQAMIPSLVPPDRIVDAFAVMVPGLQFGRLAGPAIAGLIIAVLGAGGVYGLDAATYVCLVIMVAGIPRRRLPPRPAQRLRSSIAEGIGYVRDRPVIWQLVSLDFVASFSAAYRVVLPALCIDVFDVGPAGFGLIAAAPAAGAILGAATVYRLRAVRRKGVASMGATMAFGVAVASLGIIPSFGLAVAAAVAIGYFDAVATTIRHSVVQLETPDHLRGRVSSLYQMVARGGPALGDVQVGAVASLMGPSFALGLGGLVALGVPLVLLLRGTTLRTYER